MPAAAAAAVAVKRQKEKAKAAETKKKGAPGSIAGITLAAAKAKEDQRSALEAYPKSGRTTFRDVGDELLETMIKQVPHYTQLEHHDLKAVKGNGGKIYNNLSLYCLRPYHQPRKAAIYIAESSPFDPFILLTIMCNCATMAWESPLDPARRATRAAARPARRRSPLT